MLRSFISFFLFVCLFKGFGQEELERRTTGDSVEYKQPYGLRAGVDLSRPIRSFFDDGYTGLEFVADYRLTQNLYLAGEIGNEKRQDSENLENGENINVIQIYDHTTSGSYLKLGVDFNTYENWYGMYNSIFIGGRYAVSSFSQTLNSYNIYDSNRYWNGNGFIEGLGDSEEFSGLNATWIELLFGTKVELFANFYLGASVRLGFLVTQKESDRFPNLWIPGFNKVTDGSKFGTSYNYSFTYLLPLYKKSKKPKDKSSQLSQ